jgi:hypothetical protein
MTEEQLMRRRGAQPGNMNALKHGFYSPRFNRGELTDLEQGIPYNLTDEINMLRVVIRRMLALADEGRPPEELLNILDMLGKNSQRLANLLKTNKLLESDGSSDMSAIFKQGLSDVIREMSSGGNDEATISGNKD